MKRNQKTGNLDEDLLVGVCSRDASEIYKYYKVKAGIKVARKIRTEIFSTAKQLKIHPLSGQIELNLQSLREEHRYLVKGNYKIVYKEIFEGILITDVFDTRQEPSKMSVRPER